MSAFNIISKLSENGGIISTQVLQEFYNIATKKLGLSKENAKILLERLSECFIVHKNSVLDILHAIEISIKTQFSFWDSLIISAALAEGCSYLYSEDLNSGQSVEGLIIKNPL
jgi:predicted nucleic acid-binding protein